MALIASQVSNLGAEIIGLDAVIVQQQVLAAAEEQMVAARLVSNFNFAGYGRVTNMPYMTAVDFGSAQTEGTEVTHEVHDIQEDTVTMAKYTLDLPVSYEGEAWGAASALAAIKDDVARAYANKVDGLIHAAANAATANDIDIGATFTMAHMAEAWQTLASLKAPQPYIFLMHPDHWADLWGTTTLATTAAPKESLVQGPSGGMYVGRLAGFEVYVDPNCTGTTQVDYKSVAFAQRGLWWVWKATQIPNGPQVSVANGPLGLEVGWRYDFRSYVVSGTMIGAAVVRRLGDGDTPWVVNLANPA